MGTKECENCLLAMEQEKDRHKIHYRDSIMNYVWKRPYSRELFTICGREIDCDNTTDNPDEVTCGNCLRVMAKQEKESAETWARNQ